jgi:hypothetical protein
MVGIGTALAEGFLLDNVGAFGSLNKDQKLTVAPTVNFYLNTLVDYALPEIVKKYVQAPAGTVRSAFRERVGAFVSEVSISQVVSGAGSALSEGFISLSDRVRAADIAAATASAARGVNRAVSSTWNSWAGGGYTSANFPATSYRSSWASPSAPTPAPAPTPSKPAPAPTESLTNYQRCGAKYCAQR